MTGVPGVKVRPGPSWHDLGILGLGFVLGALSSVVVYKTTDWRPAELLGFFLGITAVVLALVAFADSRSIIGKVDNLTDMTAFQHGRMDYLAGVVDKAVRQGGGAVLIPPGTIEP
jgi:hypothetical protein